MIQRVLYAVLVWTTVTVASLGLSYSGPAKVNPTGRWRVTLRARLGRPEPAKVAPTGQWVVRGITITKYPDPGPGEKVRAAGQWTVEGLEIGKDE